MSILYALVARGSIVLAEFSATAMNASSIAIQILEKLPGGDEDSHVSHSQDRYMFHVRRVDGVTVLCMADENEGMRVAFSFLEDVHQRFFRIYGPAIRSAQPHAMSDEFLRVLSQQMEYYSNNPNAERGNGLELLVDKTANMQGNTFRYRKQARQFRTNVWWRNVKLWLALAFFIVVIIYVFEAFLFHGLILSSCRN